MTTQAELEAVIEASPDDVDLYHVYGDWLQAHGDPRGELIALQTAAHRDPADKKLAARVARHADKHADVLLGALKDRRELAFTWKNGFIRDVRVGGFPVEVVQAAIRELVDHPSARFVQSIAFDYLPEIDQIVEFFLALKRPKTLADLRVTGLEDPHVEQLRAVFPRMNRSLDVEWRATLDAIAKQRKLEVRLDATALPALTRIDGTPNSVPMDTLLLGLRMELDKARGPGVVRVMKRTFTAESLDRFVVALVKLHVERGGATTRWTWHAIGPFGGVHAASWIGDSVVTWQQRALHAIDMLATIDPQHAVIVLAAIESDPRHDHEQRAQAKYQLGRLARERKIGVDDLIDRSIPAELGARGREVVTNRLRAQMIDGRRITASTMRHHIASHPAVAPLAARVVWAQYDGPTPRTTFRLAADDTGAYTETLDADGKPVDLAGSIGIVHPAELAPDARAALADRWRAAPLDPLFAQLDRPVHTYDQATIDRITARRPGLDRIRALLEHQRGWEPWSYEGKHWKRRFVRDDVVAEATCDGTAITGISAVEATTSTRIALDTLDPVTLSEVFDDLDVATADPVTDAPVVLLGPIDKGSRVEIVRGRDRGKHGLVFWTDASPPTRCGVRGDDGETYWADLAMLVAEGAVAPASTEPWFDKGARVRWKKARSEGTGTVFWMGKNKFGDGLRVGITNDADGETVWASAKECQLADEPDPA